MIITIYAGLFNLITLHIIYVQYQVYRLRIKERLHIINIHIRAHVSKKS